MAGLANKPGEYFILPDRKFVGAANLVSATSQASPSPGPVTPSSGNRGLVFPTVSGSLTANADDLQFSVLRAGGPGKGEFGWKHATDAADQWRGADDSRRFWGHHAPFTTTTPGSDNCAAAFASAFRRLVVCNIDGSTDAVDVRYRDVDSDAYDDWTQVTFNLDDPVAGGHHNAAMIDLPDGSLMLVVRVTGTVTDFDVYHSADGGSTWARVSEGIVNAFNTPDAAFPTHTLACQIRLCRSGEFIRLCWINGSGNLRTFLSTDRGISWQRLTDGLASSATIYDTGAVDDPQPFDLVSVDDAGSFLISYASDFNDVSHQYASGDGDWNYITVGVVVAPGDVYAVALVRTPEYIWEYIYWSDAGSSNADGYTIRRVRPSKYLDYTGATGLGWEEVSEAQPFTTGITYAPGRWTATWAGDRVFHFGSRRNSGSGFDDIDLPHAFYHGGWTRRSLWRNRATKPLQDIESTPLYSDFWTTECGVPSAPAGSAWASAGTGTSGHTMSRLNVQSTTGNTLAFSKTVAAVGGPAWGQGKNACFGFTARCGSGSGSLTADEVAVRIQSEDNAGTTRLDVSLRLAPGGIRVYDNNAATTLDTVTALAFDNGDYREVRFWMVKNGSTYEAQVAVCDLVTGVWYEGAVVALTSAAAGGSNVVQFGNLASPGATTDSYWREFWITDENAARQNDFVNPTSMIGAPLTSGSPMYVADGLSVRWGGLGGALLDSYDNPVAYAHAAGSIALDSPRVCWRSTAVANQTLIFDADPENGVNRWVHDAAAVFGCNNRSVLVDYDTDVAFGSPTATKTIDTTQFGTGTTALVASVVSGTALAFTDAATTRFGRGDLVGMYVRATSGGASGKTWKVTRHDAKNVVQFAGETTTLSAQGLAPGDTLVVFGGSAALSYAAPANERYMRIRLQDTDTAEGYHQIGTFVPGTKQAITVPLDWSRTDNEQPNLTAMRTRSAIGWYVEEGPPQRTFSARMVGDTTAQMRAAMRGLLRSIGYEQKPVAWVFDDERESDTAVLVRVTNGSQLDNAGFFRDDNGVIRALGDLSFALVEEV